MRALDKLADTSQGNADGFISTVISAGLFGFFFLLRITLFLIYLVRLERLQRPFIATVEKNAKNTFHQTILHIFAVI
jgi:hypothetical protein